MAPRVFSLLFLLLGVGLASAGLSRLPEKRPEAAGAGMRRAGLDMSMAELSKLGLGLDLDFKRVRRQTTAGMPVTDGHHDFEDGYPRGIVHYSGQNSDVIFVLTYLTDSSNRLTNTNLYRSTDYGSSFTNINSQLDPSDSSPVLFPFFYVSDTNKDMLVFPHSTLAMIYYTMNEGVSFSVRSFTPSSINPQSLQWHSTQEQWILAHDSVNENLYITQDLGQSWTMVANNVNLPSDYQWGVPGVDSDTSLIFYNTYDSSSTSNRDVYLYTQIQPYGNANRVIFDPALGKHDAFVIVGPYIFVQQTDSNDVISLLISHNRTPFNTAMIPSEVAHQNYLVTHINSKQALVIVEHTTGQHNLYLSDVTGVYFSLSLADIVVEEGGAIDLELIEALNGTMVSNQYVRSSPSDPPTTIRTVISLDNGAVWNLVSPPLKRANGSLYFCEPPVCSLHLHMGTSDFARLGVYSVASAPGIILAHGTVGEQLAVNPNLFISRDGGVSWEETLEGSYGASVMDFGGMIVAVDDYHREPSNTLKYSCDEGLNWSTYTFSVNDMIVFGVVTEPGEYTAVVSLFGVEAPLTNPNTVWVVVTVNFTQVFPRECVASDYYIWLPYDERTGQDCILGGSASIERRKIDRCCRNGGDYVREVGFRICACNPDDFECDYGYKHVDEFSNECVRDLDVDLADPCDSGDAFVVKTRGYRKIAGDLCTEGLESQFLPYNGSCCAASTDMPPTTPPTSTPTTSPPPSALPATRGVSSATVGLGVVLALSFFTIAVLIAIIVALLLRNAKSRRNYFRVATGEERFTFRNQSPDNEPEPLLGIHPSDEDDEPILP